MRCKYCKSLNVKKQGWRKNLFGDVQKYHCKDCDKVFSMSSNFRMRYPKKVRELALKLHQEKKSLRQIMKEVYKKTHVKVSHTAIMQWIKHKDKPYNYRYKKKCKICKTFISRDGEHICKRVPARKGDLYHCSKCNQYLPKNDFNKDKTHRHGIMCICKKCRKPIIDKRNKVVGIIRKIKRLNEKFK